MLKYLIPSPANDHRPRLLSERSVLVIAFLVVILFLLAFLQSFIIIQTDLWATIFPWVLVDLANRNREAAGLSPLTLNPDLTKAAELKASDMAAKSYFAHVSPEGATPWQWFSRAGYNYLYAGENLAVNFSESVDVDNAWMASPTHRENILRPEFSEIGIALASGYYQGQPTTFVVQLFGRPTPTFVEEPVPAPTAPPAAPQPSTPVPEAEAPIELAIQTPTFSANVESSSNVPTPPQLQSGEFLGTASYASWFEEMLLNPRRSLGWIYFAIASLIILVVVLMAVIEISRHHTLHIIYGLLILILMASLFYLYREVIFTQVLVI